MHQAPLTSSRVQAGAKRNPLRGPVSRNTAPPGGFPPPKTASHYPCHGKYSGTAYVLRGRLGIRCVLTRYCHRRRSHGLVDLLVSWTACGLVKVEDNASRLLSRQRLQPAAFISTSCGEKHTAGLRQHSVAERSRAETIISWRLAAGPLDIVAWPWDFFTKTTKLSKTSGMGWVREDAFQTERQAVSTSECIYIFTLCYSFPSSFGTSSNSTLVDGGCSASPEA